MNTRNEADAALIEAAQALENSLQVTTSYREINQQLLELIDRSVASSEKLARHLELTRNLLVIAFDTLAVESFEEDRKFTKRFILEIAKATGLDIKETRAMMGSITDALTQAGPAVH